MSLQIVKPIIIDDFSYPAQNKKKSVARYGLSVFDDFVETSKSFLHSGEKGLQI